MFLVMEGQPVVSRNMVLGFLYFFARAARLSRAVAEVFAAVTSV